MPLRILIALALLTSSTAFSQVYKCTAPDGKLEYSDKQCSESHSQRLNIRVTNSGSVCQFKYFLVDDIKGEVLATNAHQECVENLERKKLGQRQQIIEYDLWRKNFDFERSKRSPRN